MCATPARWPYHPRMPIPEHDTTRTLTLVLPESDWHALRALEPDAVQWLQSQVRDRLIAAQHPDEAPNDWDCHDQY